MTWQQRANCVGADPAWFEAPTLQAAELRAHILRAAAICARCPVTAECIEFAKAGSDTGIFGGVLLRRGKPGKLPPAKAAKPGGHCGTTYGYNQGCRCDRCKTANAKAWAKARAKREAREAAARKRAQHEAEVARREAERAAAREAERAETRAAIEALLAQGMTKVAAAKHIGISRRGLYHLMYGRAA